MALTASALLLAVGVVYAQDRSEPAGPPRDPSATLIDVRVPLGAIVWFDGARVRGDGAVRRFVTPPLEPGHRYYYNVRVTWNEGGRAREQERHVSFRPGERVLVDFAPASRTEPRDTLAVDPAAPTPWRTSTEMDPRNWPNYPDYLPGYGNVTPPARSRGP